jgi:hypothetical protein
MKFLKYLLFAAAVLFCTTSAQAQCNIYYSLGYTVSYAANYDNINKIAYTSVKSTGSASMAINVQGTCPDSMRTALQNAINTATHQLQVYATLDTAGSKTTPSSTLCASCYLTTESDLEIYNPVIGQSYNWTYGSNVLCSVGGLMNVLAQIHLYVETAFTETKAVGAPVCVLGACTQAVVPWCTTGTSPPDFNPWSVAYFGIPPFSSPGGYQEAWAECTRSPRTGRWGCPLPNVMVGVYVEDALAGGYAKIGKFFPYQPCTHNP